MFTFLRQALFQPVRPFKTTQPVAYVLNSDFMSQLWGWKPFSSVMYLVEKLRSKHTHIDINERIVEVPFIYGQLPTPTKKTKILDVGCLESTVSLSMASLGFTVTGIDIRKYPLRHPNLTTVQADICQNTFRANSFDYVTCLSTLEHIGLDTIYGKANQITDDQLAINEMHRILKPGGKLLLTTPASKKAYASNFMRHYTPQRLATLLEKFSEVEISYYAPNQTRTLWSPVPATKLPGYKKFGVALITATK